MLSPEQMHAAAMALAAQHHAQTAAAAATSFYPPSHGDYASRAGQQGSADGMSPGGDVSPSRIVRLEAEIAALKARYGLEAAAAAQLQITQSNVLMQQLKKDKGDNSSEESDSNCLTPLSQAQISTSTGSIASSFAGSNPASPDLYSHALLSSRMSAGSSSRATVASSPRQQSPSSLGPPAAHVSRVGAKSKSSCHQCKSSKADSALVFCANRSKEGVRKRRCRKKYCLGCLKRCYPQVLPPDGEEIPTGPLAATQAQPDAAWCCPACSGMCCCASCTRKKGGGGGMGRDGSNGGFDDGAEEDEDEQGYPNQGLPPLASPSSALSRNLASLSMLQGQGLNFDALAARARGVPLHQMRSASNGSGTASANGSVGGSSVGGGGGGGGNGHGAMPLPPLSPRMHLVGSSSLGSRMHHAQTSDGASSISIPSDNNGNGGGNGGGNGVSALDQQSYMERLARMALLQQQLNAAQAAGLRELIDEEVVQLQAQQHAQALQQAAKLSRTDGGCASFAGGFTSSGRSSPMHHAGLDSVHAVGAQSRAAGRASPHGLSVDTALNSAPDSSAPFFSPTAPARGSPAPGSAQSKKRKLLVDAPMGVPVPLSAGVLGAGDRPRGNSTGERRAPGAGANSNDSSPQQVLMQHMHGRSLHRGGSAHHSSGNSEDHSPVRDRDRELAPPSLQEMLDSERRIALIEGELRALQSQQRHMLAVHGARLAAHVAQDRDRGRERDRERGMDAALGTGSNELVSPPPAIESLHAEVPLEPALFSPTVPVLVDGGYGNGGGLLSPQARTIEDFASATPAGSPAVYPQYGLLSPCSSNSYGHSASVVNASPEVPLNALRISMPVDTAAGAAQHSGLTPAPMMGDTPRHRSGSISNAGAGNFLAQPSAFSPLAAGTLSPAMDFGSRLQSFGASMDVGSGLSALNTPIPGALGGGAFNTPGPGLLQPGAWTDQLRTTQPMSTQNSPQPPGFDPNHADPFLLPLSSPILG